MDKIEVTQADRLLVADILDEVSTLLDHNGIGQVADLIRDGEYDEHDCVKIAARHRLATHTDATPTCWLYRNSEGHTCVQFVQGLMDLKHWTETPLFSHPPATDVAALVEAAKRCIQIVERHNHRQNEKVEDVKLILSAALTPFTKGQNDE